MVELHFVFAIYTIRYWLILKCDGHWKQNVLLIQYSKLAAHAFGV